MFTDRDRERLRAWLESGVEDDGTRMLFVALRRNLNRITHDVGLLARLPGRLGALAREIEEQARLRIADRRAKTSNATRSIQRPS